MASSVLQNTQVVLVPEGSPLQGLAAGVLESMGWKLLEPQRMSQADVALIDVEARGGWDSVHALSQLKSELICIALVDEPHPDLVAKLQREGISDWVSRAHLATELPFRIQAARVRLSSGQEARAREKDLSLLLQLTADYAESSDIDELLHDVTCRLAKELDVIRASLIVVDEHQGTGRVVATSDDSTVKELQISLERYPEILEVLHTGRPVLIDDVGGDSRLRQVSAHLVSLGIRAIAALPLAIRGKVFGILLLRASGSRDKFNAREMDLLAAIAHATAIALRNAQLLENERGQTAKEKNARIAAEERAAQLQRYETYFANISEGIAILDESGQVLSLNPAGVELLELNADRPRGQPLRGQALFGHGEAMTALLQTISIDAVRREVDLSVETPSGKILTLSVCAAPLKEAGAAAIVSFRDVTLQRHLAEELRKTKEFLERLIDSSVDAIIAADMNGKIILFNKGAEAICGYSAHEALTGLSAKSLYPPGVARDIMHRLRSSSEGEPGQLRSCRQDIVSKSGQRVPVNLTASILYEGTEEIATVGIFTDLRDRMQLERRLYDAQTRLEESERNAVAVALAGAAAHELNQPLTSVMGYAELIQLKLKRERLEEGFASRSVDIIYREAQRMAEIVKRMNQIKRYETKSYVGEAKILDLDKAIAESLAPPEAAPPEAGWAQVPPTETKHEK